MIAASWHNVIIMPTPSDRRTCFVPGPMASCNFHCILSNVIPGELDTQSTLGPVICTCFMNWIFGVEQYVLGKTYFFFDGDTDHTYALVQCKGSKEILDQSYRIPFKLQPLSKSSVGHWGYIPISGLWTPWPGHRCFSIVARRTPKCEANRLFAFASLIKK